MVVDLYGTPSPAAQVTSSSRASPTAAPDKKQSPQHKEQPRIRRRNRIITSCLECRRRKLKCDKQQPCTNCTKFSRDCLFIAPALDPAGQAKLADLKEKMGMLERTLEQDVARRTSRSGTGTAMAPPLPGQDEGEESEQEEEEDVKGLEPSNFVTEDAAYYDDEEDNDDLIDLGVQLGKLRITERIGGLVRPRISEELTQALQDLPPEPHPQNPFTSQSPQSWMSPSRDYIPPSSSFFFAPGLHKTTALTYLPSKPVVNRLLNQYWRSVHVVARTIHRPTFERQYDRFWREIESGIEPRTSFQAVVFATLLAATVSMDGEKVLEEYAVAREGLMDNFKQGAEAALARANFLHTTKLETLQAFVIYLVALCRAEVSRAHSALTGTCIRLAECMGLHRDPTHYTTSPTEIHIRRLIWYQICFLDLRTCEATGPRPQIRRDEFDTQLPLNVDDIDLVELEAAVKAESGGGVGGEMGGGISKDVMTDGRKYFTDMTITRMRFECYEMHRLIWIERPKQDTKRTTLTSLLHKIQNFTQAMEKTYLPMLDRTQPLHVLAMQIYGILTSRMYLMVLQRFMSNDMRLMPARLRQITISCAVLVLEHSMVIEQTPALAEWAWYVGALHQNHTALLLLSEFYASKDTDAAVEARVWRCLDHVFELPADMSGPAKTRMLLVELKGRIDHYHRVRRVRTPKKMQHVGPRADSVEQQRQKAEHRDRERRSESVQSGGSSDYTASSASSMQPHHQAQMASFGGVVTQREYSISGHAKPAIPQEFDFNTPSMGYTGPGIVGGQVSGSMQQQHSPQPPTPHQYGSETSSNPNVVVGAVPGTGGSPMDLLPEIDWNEWDQLFGPAEMSTGDLIIPPFAFPDFSVTDLQWSTDQHLQ